MPNMTDKDIESLQRAVEAAREEWNTSNAELARAEADANRCRALQQAANARYMTVSERLRSAIVARSRAPMKET